MEKSFLELFAKEIPFISNKEIGIIYYDKEKQMNRISNKIELSYYGNTGTQTTTNIKGGGSKTDRRENH
jgi:hypothetical protein